MNFKQQTSQQFSVNLKNMILDILKTTVDFNFYDVFIFGSWAEGKQLKSSDIDIGISRKIISTQNDTIDIYRIKEEFMESNFPYLVDVVLFDSADQSFKEIALKHVIYLTPKDEK